MGRNAVVAVVLLVAALVAYCTVRDDREEALRSERATTISGDGGGAAVSEKHVADATHSGPIDEQRGRAHRSRFVVTTDSGVVSEARVLLPDQGVEGTTNHQGEVVLLHSREARKYIVRKIGYRTVFGNTWGAETVRVTLATGQPARGRVVLAGSGAPAEGARVSVRTLDNPPKDVDIILRTDSDGWYTIAGLGDDRPVQLTANLRGYAPVVRKANSGALPTIVLGAGRRLEGFVTDASGTALPGVAVFVVVSGHDYFVSPPDLEGPVTATGVFDKMLFGRALTDASGRYSIEGLDVPGVYTVVAFGYRYGSARIRGVRLLRSQSPGRLDLRIEVPAALRMTVESVDGETLRDASIHITGTEPHNRGLSHLSAADDLPPGLYKVRVAAPGYVPRTVEVELKPGEDRELRVIVHPGNSISGTLVDEAGRPVPGMLIEFDATGEAQHRDGSRAHSKSAKDGSFKLGGLLACRGTLTVGEPLSQGSGDIAAPLGKFAPHRVEGVGSAATGLRVVVRRAAGVVGEFDSGLWPDLYAAYGASARLLNPTMELVGDMGFEIRGLPLGEAIELRFSELGFAPVVLQLDPLTAGERRELGKVRFTKGVTMSGTVRDESGAPIEGAHVVASGDGARGEAVTDAEGRFRVPNLRRDVRRIGVAADGYVKRIQWLTEGAALDGVAITLTTGGIVAGRLLDADGEPAAMGEDCLLAVRRRDDTETEFGSFVFEDAASEFRLRLEPGKYFLAIVSWKGGKLTEVSRHAFEIREGETTKLDVALK